MLKKSTSPPPIKSEAGWQPHSPYGTLKTIRGESLERLENVHAWLMQRDGIPSASAAARVLGPFVADANSELGMKHGADKLRQYLHILDLSGPSSSIGELAGRMHMAKAADLVPYVPHHHFASGTLAAFFYALGLMAGEVWAPHSGDVDLNDRLDGGCADGDFPTAEKARAILGPFAIPLPLAHALWGWGELVKSAEVLHLKSAPVAPAVESTGAQPAAGEGTANDWRKKVKGAAWTEAQNKLLIADFQAEKGKTAIAKREAVAKRWGLGSDAIKKQLGSINKKASKAAKPEHSWINQLGKR